MRRGTFRRINPPRDIAYVTNITRSQALAATLRAIRDELNLTQEQLAERLGVSFATVNRWEGGANLPQKAARATIAVLAEEAGVDMAEAGFDDIAAAEKVTRRRAGKRSTTPSTKSMEQSRHLADIAMSDRYGYESALEWHAIRRRLDAEAPHYRA